MSCEQLSKTPDNNDISYPQRIINQLTENFKKATSMEEIYRKALGWNNAKLLPGWRELTRNHIKSARNILSPKLAIYNIKGHEEYLISEVFPIEFSFIPENHLEELKNNLPSILLPLIEHCCSVKVINDTQLLPKLPHTLFLMLKELLKAFPNNATSFTETFSRERLSYDMDLIRGHIKRLRGIFKEPELKELYSIGSMYQDFSTNPHFYYLKVKGGGENTTTVRVDSQSEPVMSTLKSLPEEAEITKSVIPALKQSIVKKIPEEVMKAEDEKNQKLVTLTLNSSSEDFWAWIIKTQFSITQFESFLQQSKNNFKNTEFEKITATDLTQLLNFSKNFFERQWEKEKVKSWKEGVNPILIAFETIRQASVFIQPENIEETMKNFDTIKEIFYRYINSTIYKPKQIEIKNSKN